MGKKHKIDRVYEYLIKHKQIDDFISINQLGYKRLSGAINVFRYKRKMDIETKMIQTKDMWGDDTEYCVYIYHGQKEELEV